MDLDSDPPSRLRVACYVTREHAGRLELLVFDHADFPEAGTQIPAGGVEPGETFPAAGLREVREETGLEQVEFVRLLGESDRSHPTTGDSRLTTYLHLRLTGETVDRWRHVVRGRGADADLRFDCRWEPLPIELR
jgi:8-oxo-dGTP pyrophosphatase MutT (NUDIX family)